MDSLEEWRDLLVEGNKEFSWGEEYVGRFEGVCGNGLKDGAVSALHYPFNEVPNVAIQCERCIEL